MTKNFDPEPASPNKIKWVKQRDISALTFIKSNVVAYCGRGSTITFVNIDDGSEHYYHCQTVCSKNDSHDDKLINGVSCLAAHKTCAVFAFAELSLTARIVLMTYPDFRHITTLENDEREKVGEYISLDFSETEHIIALTSLPQYLIEIWNWRTDRLMVYQPTHLIADDKFIRCSYSFPLTVFQLSQSQPKMDFWEVHFSLDTANLIKKNIKLPAAGNSLANIFDATFGIDGSLYAISKNGAVWDITPGSSKIIVPPIIDESNIASGQIICFNSDLIVARESTVKLFKKNVDKWSESWSYSHNCCIKSMACYEQQLVILSAEGDIFKMKGIPQGVPGSLSIATVRKLFKLIVLVNPVGEFFVTTTESDEIVVYNIKNGKEEGILEIDGIHCMTSHDSLPVIALGTSTGMVYILSILDAKVPIVLHEFFLCTERIDCVQFMPNGQDVVANSEQKFFVITGEFGGTMKISKLIKLEISLLVLDFTITTIDEKTRNLVVLTCPCESSKHFADSITEIAVYEAPDERLRGNLPYFYTSIKSNSEIERSCVIGARYDSKIIDIVGIKRDEGSLKPTILKSIETNQHLNYIEISIDRHFLLSWSFDGIISVWNMDDMEFMGKYPAHNRYTYGVKTAVCTPSEEFMISLGRSGNIICTQLASAKHQSRKLLTLKDAIGGTSLAGQYKKDTEEENDDENSSDKPWLAIQQEQELENIRRKYASEKQNILNEFNSIKEKLKICIDANEADPPEEQLPINSFNLDPCAEQSLIELARAKREQEQDNLKQSCIERNQLIDWIKQNTWELMEVKSTKLHGIFSKLCVENYALHHTDKEFEENIRRIHFWRSREQIAGGNDVFHPWIPRSVEELEKQLTIKPNTSKTDESFVRNYISFADRVRSHFSFKNQKSLSVDRAEWNANYALSGTSTHLYVKPLEIRYEQMEVISYNQMYAEHQMGFYDLLQLRKYFNKKFDALMNEKKTEMNLVKERNKRLLYIQGELNVLADIDGSASVHSEIINDPEFLPDEVPETIVQVQDAEVSVTPYISTSQQDLLDRQAEEAERRRQEMLKDDFRERALMTMMDGVLEIRWEDEIKKDPMKPHCLECGMDPMDYTEEDAQEIEEYEEKLKHVKSERRRYSDVLLEEKNSVDQQLETQILHFNRKVSEMLLSKIRIEFAICSEDMKLLLYSMFNFERNQFREKEDKLLKEKCDIKNDIDELMKTLSVLDGNFYSCKMKYDELFLKDKVLDRQFKTSFAEYAAQAVVDQAYRIFKRRPKLQPRAWQTATILSDMARRVTAADTSMTGPPLPDECFQYLNVINNIDKFSNAPNLLDQNLWHILCRMRRARIDVEIKLRSYAAQVAEAEAAVNAYSREISYRKSKLAQCDKKLDDLKEQQAKHLINRNVQIYTKRGNVEIPLCGRMSDFENAILLHKTNLNETNALIQEAGKKKLKVMQNASAFRRHVQCQEWKHKVLKMKIDDMKNFIKFIDKCKVTKEVQIWLKRKQLGRTEDLSDTAIERDISVRIGAYERVNHDLMKKINRLDALIENEMRQNDILDRKIQNLNFDIQEQSMTKDILFGEKEQERRNERMETIMERARLVRKVQQQHGQILEHSTLLELQRLRTYPTLNLSSKAPDKLNRM